MRRCCWGPKPGQHVKGCRLGRPLCRWRRATNPKRRVCECPAYWFPHRIGSGLCGDKGILEREQARWYAGQEEKKAS